MSLDFIYLCNMTEKLVSPWTSIWLKPRATIQQIIASGNFGVRLIILFFGITFGISSALNDAENLQELFVKGLVAVITSPIVTIILLFIIRVRASQTLLTKRL